MNPANPTLNSEPSQASSAATKTEIVRGIPVKDPTGSAFIRQPVNNASTVATTKTENQNPGAANPAAANDQNPPDNNAAQLSNPQPISAPQAKPSQVGARPIVATVVACLVALALAVSAFVIFRKGS